MMRTNWVLAMGCLLGAAVYGCAGKKSEPASTEQSVGSEGSAAEAGAGESGAGGSGGRGGSLGLPTVYFDFDQAVIRGEDRPILQQAATELKSGDASVTIEGHCDERGSVEYNLALGERRAQAVKSYLTKLGVSANKLNTISYGEERPATMGSGEEPWSKNRRAEMLTNR